MVWTFDKTLKQWRFLVALYKLVIFFCFLAICDDISLFSANFNQTLAVQESKCRVGADGKYDLYVLARPAMEVAFAGGSGELANGRFQKVGVSLGNMKKRWCFWMHNHIL